MQCTFHARLIPRPSPSLVSYKDSKVNLKLGEGLGMRLESATCKDTMCMFMYMYIHGYMYATCHHDTRTCTVYMTYMYNMQ